MANLIIKSSADNLVLQGSDASPAITVGATGTTTFAENATLSGTGNNLGTATAGTLSHGTTLQGWADASNTGVTFPAGHVVQTTTTTYAGTRTDVSTGSTDGTYQQTVVTGSITPQYDDSSIIVHANFTVHIHGESGGDTGYAMRWKKTGTGTTVGYVAEMNMSPTSANHSTFYRNAFNYISLSDYYSMSMMNNDCETTNQVTYTLWVSPYYTDGTCWVGNTTWSNTRWMIYLQEIKR